MPGPDLIKAVVDAGVGALIALIVLMGVYRIISGLGNRFVDAEHRQAEAMGAQAQAVSGLTASIQEFVRTDNTEHREMLVLLRFIAQQQKELEEVRVEHNIRKKQAHPHCPARTP